MPRGLLLPQGLGVHGSGSGPLWPQRLCSAAFFLVLANSWHILLLKQQQGIVTLTKSSSSDPQDTGLQSVANPPYWASKAAVSLNLTIPSGQLTTVS